MDGERVVHAQRPPGHRLRDRGRRGFEQALDAPELQVERPYSRCGPFSLPSCPAHRSLPGPRRIWRRASCPSSPAHVMPRCPRQILAAVVNRCIGGRPRSLISSALACGLADSSRDRGAGMTKKPHSANYASARRLLRVAIKTSKRRCWRQLCDEVNNDVWGKPYKIAMSRLGCPQAKQPSSPLLVRAAVAALFLRVPSGPALRLPRRAEEPISAVTLEELKGA
ncbi:unnamed protein product [Trichogramma brassicae]|uniref:Uncharacterized protein n=1 Tax=Trichogramma brassicae TaxID=86971 RepID=A0A6H5IYE0_9HYME|nr:unnamed protein product [Trichogramma brassicae]